MLSQETTRCQKQLQGQTPKEIVTVLDRVESRSWSVVNEDPPPETNPPTENIPLSYRTNLKNDTSTVTTNSYLDREVGTKEPAGKTLDPVTEPKIDHYLEIHEGGSLVRVKSTEVHPFKEGYHADGKEVRGQREVITRFTTKSRRNLLQKLSCVNQDRIPTNRVKFITLTVDGEDTPPECKKYLNNFLTQMRQRYDGCRWWYTWKAEFQKRGVLHFHIVTFGLQDISHKWIRHTWSRIQLGYAEYKRRCDASDDQKEVFKSLVVTEIECSRGWGRTEQYFSKTLAYVSKHGTEEEQLIERHNRASPDRVGRWWGIGRGEVYNSYINRLVYKITEKDWGKVRRVFINALKGTWMRKYKGKFNWRKWKEYERYLKCGYRKIKYTTQTIGIWKLNPEVSLFMKNEDMTRLCMCLFPDKEPPFAVEKRLSFSEWVNVKEKSVI